jgi:hypothetical protein
MLVTSGRGRRCSRRFKVRKNAKDMTAEEISDFVNAVLTLKASPSPYSDTLSYYDTFVRFHHMTWLRGTAPTARWRTLPSGFARKVFWTGTAVGSRKSTTLGTIGSRASLKYRLQTSKWYRYRRLIPFVGPLPLIPYRTTSG